MITTTKPIHAVIVEDEPLGRDVIRELLRTDSDVNVVAECSNGRDAIAVIESQRPELVFLDVRMPEIDGFDVLSGLNTDRLPVVVFVTAYDEYAVRAFEVNAVDYLLKPFDRERFYRAVARAKAQVRRNEEESIGERILSLLERRHLERFVVKSRGRILFIKSREVDWIEAEGNYARLHVQKESHLIRNTIGSLETQLDPERFVRIHRSQIVNMDRICELRPWWHGEYRVILKDGTELTLSRSYRERVRALIFE